MKIKLVNINKIKTNHVLYDKKLKKFVIYPRSDDEYKKTLDIAYIKKHCKRLKIVKC